MKKIIVEIAGDSPLLMHNPASMGRGDAGGKKSIPTAEAEAAASRYLTADGKGLAIKADHIHRCLIEASKGFRLRGRESVLPYMSGSIEVMPDIIPLRKKQATDYTVDTRRCVINKKGVLRSRALVWPWSATFEVHYDEDVFTTEWLEKNLHDQIMLRAGKAIGLLDYRPQKYGKFGRWHVTKFEV
jgi:hypothetical protein